LVNLARGMQGTDKCIYTTNYFVAACDNFNNYVRFIVIDLCLSIEQVTMNLIHHNYCRNIACCNSSNVICLVLQGTWFCGNNDAEFWFWRTSPTTTNIMPLQLLYFKDSASLISHAYAFNLKYK